MKTIVVVMVMIMMVAMMMIMMMIVMLMMVTTISLEILPSALPSFLGRRFKFSNSSL